VGHSLGEASGPGGSAGWIADRVSAGEARPVVRVGEKPRTVEGRKVGAPPATVPDSDSGRGFPLGAVGGNNSSLTWPPGLRFRLDRSGRRSLLHLACQWVNELGMAEV